MGECAACQAKSRDKRNVHRSALGADPLQGQALADGLRVSMPSDPLEREAEATAARVMRAPASPRSSSPQSGSNLHRAPSQRAPASIRNRGGPGSPLPERVRADYEGRFGHDFSGVRVHHSAQAASLSRAYQARAFTVGSDIYFNRGEFNPSSRSGGHLLAHELTHVVQQSGPASASRKSPSHSADALRTPIVGSGHPMPHGHPLAGCSLDERQVRSSRDWCLDTFQRHTNERCYRRIPREDCAPSDQYCYTSSGACHSSPDRVSPVESTSPGAGSTCNNSTICTLSHIWYDVL